MDMRILAKSKKVEMGHAVNPLGWYDNKFPVALCGITYLKAHVGAFAVDKTYSSLLLTLLP